MNNMCLFVHACKYIDYGYIKMHPLTSEYFAFNYLCILYYVKVPCLNFYINLQPINAAPKMRTGVLHFYHVSKVYSRITRKYNRDGWFVKSRYIDTYFS